MSNINIALNDTTKFNNIISYGGSGRIITLRTKDFTSSNPLMDILIEGNPINISFTEKLSGLKLNDDNKFLCAG
ncbi:MAG: hypothetical protein MZV64_07710 [Ignavibacteriales bacterium]|nr:hypothetical protein [Ignavibacteriales bacterium]